VSGRPAKPVNQSSAPIEAPNGQILSPQPKYKKPGSSGLLYFDPVAGRAEPASGARKEAQPTPRDKNQILSPQPHQGHQNQPFQAKTPHKRGFWRLEAKLSQPSHACRHNLCNRLRHILTQNKQFANR
jgi:hypothetical protein